MMRNVPSAIPTATPSATETLSPQTPMAPAETSLALIATAMSDGSAMVVAKPTQKAKR